MDLHPSFGPQELMETLSQSSSGTGKSGGEQKSTNSGINKKDSIAASRSNHHQLLLAGDSQVYEAVRKLGRRLSIQAHGGTENIHDELKKTIRLHRSAQSGFFSYRNDADQNKDERRKNKVLKTRYSDHGEHDSNLQSSHGSCHRHLVRRITFECKDRFRKWEEEEISRKEQQEYQQIHQQEEPSKLSPQHYSLSKLTLESHSSLAPQSVTGNASPSNNEFHNPSGGNIHNRHRRPSNNNRIGLGISIDEETAHDRWTQRGAGFHDRLGLLGERTAHHGGKGLLSAVMEGASDSNASGYPGADSPASQSISTKDSKTSLKSQRSGSASTSRIADPPLPRGKCLTSPPEPVENGGLDNIEGNLIVHENDSIVVPRKNIRTVRKGKAKDNRIRSAEFRVQKLQGQGTFAQVFQCLHVQTGQNVALKIIKNKPAYTRQAAIEIDIFQTLQDDERHHNMTIEEEPGETNRDYMVNLISYFMYQNHLCLVFELLGMNLYEVLKKRSFFGLPLTVVRDIVQQAVEGIRDLSQKNVVHCDLKPENILLVSEEDGDKLLKANEQKSSVKSHDSKSSDTLFADSSGGTPASGSSKTTSQDSSNAMTIQAANLLHQSSSCKIKLIDFGSACFEGYTAHTYIQSRFYRSPEVLIGLPYDSAIDMWSLGCVAAELFLGLPILPGVHEHDQLCRITDMIGKVPDWMLEQGSKTTKYFTKYVPRGDSHSSPGTIVCDHTNSSTRKTTNSPSSAPAPPLPRWRIKTQEEYVSSLTESEVCKKGGLEKLSKPPGNRYFKRQKLSDILILHAQNSSGEDRRLVPAFVHFLYGILDPDPWKRLTALQAAQHPFVTGNLSQLRVRTSDIKLNPKEENQANLELEVYWPSPWDPAVCRRKLLNVQKIREKQQALRRNVTPRPNSASRSSPVTGTASLASVEESRRGTGNSPPSLLPSSHSNSTLHANYSASASRDGAPSSSWTDYPPAYQSGHHPLTTNATQSNQVFTRFLDASSVQSVQTSGLTSTETDFAQALQRPGVFPGYGFASSMTSTDSPAIFQQNGMLSSQISVQTAPPYGPSFPQYRNNQQFASPLSSQMLSMTNQPMVTPLGRVSGTSFVSQDQSVPQANPLPRPNSPSAMSVASSVTMQDISYVDPQQLAIMQLQQQQQFAFQQFGLLQQPLQQQQHVMHQQVYANQYTPQASFPQPPQPHQQALLLAGAQGAGYYYVTTSAGGQPILLQPVGMLNHTGGQQMLNQTPSLGPLNQQMYVQQMSSLPQMQAPGNVAYAQTSVLNNMFVDMQPGFNPPVQSQQLQPPQRPRQQQGLRKNFNGHVQYPRGSSM